MSGLKVVAVGNAFDGINLYGPFFTYEAASDFADTLGRLNSWEIITVEAPFKGPDGSDEAVGLFSGVVPDLDGETEALVTMWPDGAVELALRANPTHSWGPPAPLESKETR